MTLLIESDTYSCVNHFRSELFLRKTWQNKQRIIQGCAEIPDLFRVLNVGAANEWEISCSTREINLVFPSTHVFFCLLYKLQVFQFQIFMRAYTRNQLRIEISAYKERKYWDAWWEGEEWRNKTSNSAIFDTGFASRFPFLRLPFTLRAPTTTNYRWAVKLSVFSN